MRNSERKYVLMKKEIVHVTMTKITMTNIYASMARMSVNDEFIGGFFCDSPQLTN